MILKELEYFLLIKRNFVLDLEKKDLNPIGLISHDENHVYICMKLYKYKRLYFSHNSM